MVKKNEYTVLVNDVPACYKAGHFPRRFARKVDAVNAAREAVANGASMARVEFPGSGELDFRPEKTNKPKAPAKKAPPVPAPVFKPGDEVFHVSDIDAPRPTRYVVKSSEWNGTVYWYTFTDPSGKAEYHAPQMSLVLAPSEEEGPTDGDGSPPAPVGAKPDEVQAKPDRYVRIVSWDATALAGMVAIKPDADRKPQTYMFWVNEARTSFRFVEVYPNLCGAVCVGEERRVEVLSLGTDDLPPEGPKAKCSCLGFRNHGACKHARASVALALNGWKE